MKKVDTKLSISRITSNKEADFIEITVEDSRSATLISISRISLEEFALALTGLCNRPSITQLFDTYENAGKKLETRWIIMRDIDSWSIKSAEELVAKRIIEDHFKGTEFYLDDWEIMDYCLNRRQDGEFYQYIIHRYVEE